MAQVFNDSFNRSENPLYQPDYPASGMYWVIAAGNIKANGTKAESTAAGNNVAVVDTGLKDTQVGCTFSTVSTVMRMYYRYTDDTKFWAFQYYSVTPRTAVICRTGGTDYYKIDLNPYTLYGGEKILVTFSGNNHELFIDGVSKGTCTATDFNTITKQGIGQYNNTAARWDDFYVGDPPPSVPVVTSCTPADGPTCGGTSITNLAGSLFTGATGVTFGGVAATSVSVVSDTQITCVTPAHAAGAVNIVVTTSAGNGTLVNGFTYHDPTISSSTPNVGPTCGGTSITNLAGTYLTGATTVTFGGTSATSISVVSDTQITCVTPAHAAGAVNVVVGNGTSTGTGTNAFTYHSPEPSAITPNVGVNCGGTSITNLAGAYFTGATGVTFGGVSATSVSVVSDTQITCVTPAHSAGAVDVIINNGTSTGTLAASYTYVVPTVTSCTPSTGTTAGGTSITNLAGTNFTNATSVQFGVAGTFGWATATSFSVVSDTKITCVTPAAPGMCASTGGLVNICVYNSIGGYQGTNLFTYIKPPAPTLCYLSSGGTGGGLTVTITGTAFKDTFATVTGVTFGGTAATSVVVPDTNTLTCKTPSHAAGTVDIVLTKGSTTGTLTNGFTYVTETSSGGGSSVHEPSANVEYITPVGDPVTNQNWQIVNKYMAQKNQAKSVSTYHINWGLSPSSVSAVNVPIEDVAGYYTGTEVETALKEAGATDASLNSLKEDKSNKVTSISGSSTDTQYPSAKLAYDQLAIKQATLVSGTNIKTLNGNPVIGSGDLAVIPVGCIILYGLSTAPTGWVLCDGTSYAKVGTYANLYAVIGTTFGTADVDHFNVPYLGVAFMYGITGMISYIIKI